MDPQSLSHPNALSIRGGRFGLRKSPSPPPGGGWPRRGRERNAGENLKVSTIKQASSRVTTKLAHWWRSLHFRNCYIAARIPLQSEKRSFGTAFLTASPRGKRFRATHRMAGLENPPMPKTEKQHDQLQITTSLRARKGVAISLIPAGDCQKVNCPEGAREATLGCVGLCPPRNDVVIWGGSL